MVITTQTFKRAACEHEVTYQPADQPDIPEFVLEICSLCGDHILKRRDV
ncbi:hypothetical protein SEA_NICEHOUSE_252 [Rhodococcus phage NiceHouse]|nr:hypothetical protein SEA_NICEHOUSE_252 [Rhodococcus phage NiceHouse]